MNSPLCVSIVAPGVPRPLRASPPRRGERVIAAADLHPGLYVHAGQEVWWLVTEVVKQGGGVLVRFPHGRFAFLRAADCVEVCDG